MFTTSEGTESNTLFFFFRENDPSWAIEIQDDVIEECNKHGGVVHIYVDKNSTQVSYLKIPLILRKEKIVLLFKYAQI